MVTFTAGSLVSADFVAQRKHVAVERSHPSPLARMVDHDIADGGLPPPNDLHDTTHQCCRGETHVTNHDIVRVYLE